MAGRGPTPAATVYGPTVVSTASSAKSRSSTCSSTRAGSTVLSKKADRGSRLSSSTSYLSLRSLGSLSGTASVAPSHNSSSLMGSAHVSATSIPLTETALSMRMLSPPPPSAPFVPTGFATSYAGSVSPSQSISQVGVPTIGSQSASRAPPPPSVAPSKRSAMGSSPIHVASSGIVWGAGLNGAPTYTTMGPVRAHGYTIIPRRGQTLDVYVIPRS